MLADYCDYYRLEQLSLLFLEILHELLPSVHVVQTADCSAIDTTKYHMPKQTKKTTNGINGILDSASQPSVYTVKLHDSQFSIDSSMGFPLQPFPFLPVVRIYATLFVSKSLMNMYSALIAYSSTCYFHKQAFTHLSTL